jgi:phospholipid/cholesterol/gamma-HCH transport system permease protein
MAVLSNAFYTLGFFARTIKGIHHFVFRGRAAYRNLIMQILFTSVDALFITALLALTIGAAVNIIGIPFLDRLGQGRMIYPLLIVIITRELGPLLTAFIIIARSATAIATEMAGMVISHEIEAYIAIGIDPFEHLAVPRFLGVTISLFLLNIYFSIFGLSASYVVAQFFNTMTASVYFRNILQNLSLRDVLMSLIKSVSFGMIISIISVVQGMSVERSSTEVPVAGLRAVSNAFLWCIIADIILSALFYLALL